MAAREAIARARRSWPQRLLLGTGAVLAVVCLASAVGLGYVAWKLSRVDRLGDVGDLVDAGDGQPENFLLVGSDSREGVDEDDPDAAAFLNGESGGRRSDTIVLLRVDPRSTQVSMLSLPRDLWVPIAGTGESNRINSAYGRGRQVLIDTIEEDFGIPIHHYVEVDFAGFKGLVDAIDGVPMYFETPVRDEQSGLDVPVDGCVTLDPDQALAFARSRHYEYLTDDDGWETDPSGDHGRISRQQAFLFRAFDRAKDRGLTNPVTLNRLIDVALDNVGVDPGLSDGEIIALARRFSSIDQSRVTTLRLPVEEDIIGEAYVLRLVSADAQDELNVFRGLPPDAIAPEAVTVRVLNGSGTEHQATDAADELADRGFVVSAVGDADEHADRTEVRYAPDRQAAASLVARYLEAGAEVVADATVDPSEVVLTTGTDFTGVLRTPAPASSVEVTAPTTGVTAADPSSVAVEVLNGTSVTGQAAEAADDLGDEGFTIVGTGDWDETVERTVVYYPSGAVAAAEAVADHLAAGADVVEDPSMGGDGVVLVTGADFDGVGAPAAGDDGPELPSPTPTTSTSAPGVVPGEPPPGVGCG
jgi:polyisoprenyl-teichoic acid--peptidoglycan teichoic acid transferase